MKKFKILMIFMAVMMMAGSMETGYAFNMMNNTVLTKTVTKTEESNLSVAEKEELLIDQKKKIEYSTASDDDITFESSDEKIAAVDEHGYITGKAEGVAYITVKQGEYEYDCEVTVYKEDTIAVPESIEILAGEEYQLEPKMLGNTENYKFKVDDEDIASVDSDGLITGNEAGKTVITIENGKYKSEVEVNVVNEVSLSVKKLTVIKGETKSLTVTSNSSQTPEFSIENEKIATVDEDGNVTGIKQGTTTVTTKIGEVEYTSKIVVKKAVTASVPQKIEVVKGENKRLKVTTASVKEIKYSSSDPSVFTINSNGLIKGRKVGKATAYVTVGSKEYKCTVTITNNIKIEAEETQEMILDEQADFLYESNSVKIPEYTSSDEQIVSIDENGIMTAKQAGKATITASIGTKSDSTEVTVMKDLQLDVTESMDLIKGNKQTIEVETNSTRTPEYVSSDTSVATVTASGVVKAKGEGKAEISITIGNVEKKCEVNVISEVTIEIEGKNTIKKGETVQLNVSTNTNSTVTYKSSDSKVATVTSKGEVKGIKAGKATITVSCKGESKEFEIEVQDISVKINNGDQTLTAGQTLQLDVSVTGDSKENVYYGSSDGNIANVSKDGVVTGIKAGTVTIKAKLGDGSIYGSIKVTVKQDPKVKIGNGDLTISVGQKVQLNVTTSDASGYELSYGSSDGNIVNVSQDGVVTGIKAGSATIKAKLGDGTIYDKITVTVKQNPSIQITNGNLTLTQGQTAQLNVTTSDASGYAISYGSSDGNIVNVSQSGKVTAIKAGSVTVKAKLGDGSIYAAITVTVKAAAAASSNKTGGGTQTQNSTTAPAASTGGGVTYILNTKSKKFHRTTCHSLPTSNRQDTTLSRDQLIAQGYSPCKNCNP